MLLSTLVERFGVSRMRDCLIHFHVFFFFFFLQFFVEAIFVYCRTCIKVVSVLLSALVERFGVSRMRDFYILLSYLFASLNEVQVSRYCLRDRQTIEVYWWRIWSRFDQADKGLNLNKLIKRVKVKRSKLSKPLRWSRNYKGD